MCETLKGWRQAWCSAASEGRQTVVCLLEPTRVWAAFGPACLCTLARGPPFPSCRRTSAPRETVSLLSHLPNLYGKVLIWEGWGSLPAQVSCHWLHTLFCGSRFSGRLSHALLVFSLHFHWRRWQDPDSLPSGFAQDHSWTISIMETFT